MRNHDKLQRVVLLLGLALLLAAGPWLAAAASAVPSTVTADNPIWVRQFGSDAHDNAEGIAVGPTGVYVAGNTSGSFPGQLNAGDLDVFMRKYDAAGNEQWTHQFGTIRSDVAAAVAVDDTGVYVAGRTDDTFPGQSRIGSPGHADAFVRKYDANGNEVWTHQFGSGQSDEVSGIAVDATVVYVTGYTGGSLPGQIKVSGPGSSDGFIRKYDASGNELWTRQFGISDSTWGYAITIDTTGVYIAGDWRQLGGDSHVFVQKYDTAGNELWTRQFASAAQDLSAAIAADHTGVYVVGHTFGSLPGQHSIGHGDAFVRKYDTAGNELWTHQFGTANSDAATGVSVDATGVYVGGTTWGALLDQTNYGASDAFVRKYDADGNELWTRQFGSGAEDRTHGVAIDNAGVYLVGLAGGVLPGQTSAGLSDAFVVEYDLIGPPSSNRLSNGGFESGKAAWQFYTNGQGYFSTGDQAYAGSAAARLHITKVGNNTQLFQTGFTLEPTTRYRLQFAAKSNKGHDLSVYLHRHSDPYTNYGLSNFRFNLTSAWKRFTVEFTTRNLTSATTDTRLRFWLSPFATAGDDYWIDEVSLVKLPPRVSAAALAGTGEVAGMVQGLEGIATVKLVDLETGGSMYQMAITTDAAGAFRFDQAPIGPYELSVEPPAGYLPPELVQLLVSEEPNEEFVFVLEGATNSIYLPLVSQ